MSINPILISQRLSGVELQGRGQIFIVQDTSVTPSFNVFNINTQTRIATMQGLFQTITFIIGIPAPVPLPPGVPLYIYDNDASTIPQILIEQDGAGDSALSFLLSGGKQYIMGIDNSQVNDPLKISLGNALGAAASDVLFLDEVDCNIGLGLNALDSVTPATAANNLAFGNNALTALVIGLRNVALGCSSLILATGNNNVGVGWSTLSLLVTGTDNIALGNAAGNALTGADSNNILIGNPGVVGDDNTIRLGTSGTHTCTFLTGSECWVDEQYVTPLTTDTVTILNTTSYVIIDPAGTLAALNIDMPASPKDGQLVKISITQDITAMVHDGNGNTLVAPFDPAPGTITANASGTWYYRLADTTWYPMGVPVEGGTVESNSIPSVDNAIARYDGVTGILIEDSLVLITDAGVMNGATQINVDNLRLDGNTLSSTDAAGAINIAPDTTGAVNIGVGAAARTITIGNATGATSLVLNAGTGAVSLGSNAIAHATTIGSLTGTAATTLQSGTGDLALTSTDAVTVDAVGVLELNSSAGIIGIGNDAVAQNINVGTGAAARTITIGNATGATSLVLNAGTGAVNVGTNAIAHTVTLGNVTGATAVNLNAGTGGIALASTGTGDITLDSDDTLLLDSDGVLELNSSAGIIGIGNDADAFGINVGTGAAARPIVIGNATGATSIALNAGTGAVNLGSNAIAHATTVGSLTGAAATTVQSGTGDLSLTSTDEINMDAAGVLSINSSAGVINMGDDAVAQNMNIGTGAAARIITVGNGTGATSVVLAAGTGNIDIGVGAFARIVNLGTGAAAQTVSVGSTNGASTLALQSGTGTIDIGVSASARAVNVGTAAAVQTVIVGSTNTTSATTIQGGTGGSTIIGAIFTGAAIAGATVLDAGDSGTTYAVTQDGVGYVITLPTAAAGLNYKFLLVGADSADTDITATSTHLIGTTDINSVVGAIAGSTSIVFDGGSGAVGDTIELIGISATQWMVRGISSAAGGITLA